MINNTHKFWIQHKKSVKQHWPMVLVHVVLAIFILDLVIFK